MNKTNKRVLLVVLVIALLAGVVAVWAAGGRQARLRQLALNTRLVQAVVEGDLQGVVSLLDKGADVNTPYAEHEGQAEGNLLEAAIRRGNLGMAGALVARGIDVNGRSNSATPLGYACLLDDIDMVKLVLAGGADVNGQEQASDFPLWHACERGSREIVELLISHGADVNKTNPRGTSSLTVAVIGSPWRAREIEKVELLLANGADVHQRSYWGFTAMDHAAVYHEEAMMELLIEHGAVLSLFGAVRFGDLDVIQEMIEAQPESLNALIPGYTSGHIGLTKNGDVGECALGAVVRNPEVLRFLLGLGADPDGPAEARGYPLRQAAGGDSADSLDALLAAGAGPDTADFRGEAALHIAARGSKMKTVRLLTEAGANVNAETNAGLTPLDLARKSGHRYSRDAVVEYIQSRGGKAGSRQE